MPVSRVYHGFSTTDPSVKRVFFVCYLFVFTFLYFPGSTGHWTYALAPDRAGPPSRYKPSSFFTFILRWRFIKFSTMALNLQSSCAIRSSSDFTFVGTEVFLYRPFSSEILMMLVMVAITVMTSPGSEGWALLCSIMPDFLMGAQCLLETGQGCHHLALLANQTRILWARGCSLWLLMAALLSSLR